MLCWIVCSIWIKHYSHPYVTSHIPYALKYTVRQTSKQAPSTILLGHFSAPNRLLCFVTLRHTEAHWGTSWEKKGGVNHLMARYMHRPDLCMSRGGWVWEEGFTDFTLVPDSLGDIYPTTVTRHNIISYLFSSLTCISMLPLPQNLFFTASKKGFFPGFLVLPNRECNYWCISSLSKKSYPSFVMCHDLKVNVVQHVL